MDYEEVIHKWGRKLLKEAGKTVKDDEAVSVNLSYQESGYCETCSYTEGVVEIWSSSGSITIESYGFTQALNELIAISSSEGVAGTLDKS